MGGPHVREVPPLGFFVLLKFKERKKEMSGEFTNKRSAPPPPSFRVICGLNVKKKKEKHTSSMPGKWLIDRKRV